MPRYIDADELIRLLEIDAVCQGDYFSKRDAIRCVKTITTADVVPKSEVEKLIIDRNAARLGMIAEHERLKMARAEVASKIFAEIAEKLEGLFDFFRQDDCIRESSAIMLAISKIAELKKKYTEGDK